MMKKRTPFCGTVTLGIVATPFRFNVGRNETVPVGVTSSTR